MCNGHPDLYINKLEEISNTPVDSDIGYFIEVDLRHPDKIKEKTKNFPFCPENKIIPKIKIKDVMDKIKPKNFTKARKLKSDWTDRKNNLLNIGC